MIGKSLARAVGFEGAGKRVLVTGGAGFIGSHLVEQLAQSGFRVTVVDNLSGTSVENLASAGRRVEFIKMDILDERFQKLLRDCSFEEIYHLAANAYVPPSVEAPAWDCNINFWGTFRILETLRKLGWKGTLVYASSGAVYGNPVRLPIEEDDAVNPISPYGVSKLASERYVAVYSRLYGLRAASVRFFSTYGPRQRKQVVYDFLEKLHQNPREMHLYGDGTQIRDFNYVEDAARGILTVAARGELSGEVYNVASGREESIQHVAELLCDILGLKPVFLYSGAVRPGDPQRWAVDIQRIRALGYSPAVSLREGLERTVNWYRDTSERGRCVYLQH